MTLNGCLAPTLLTTCLSAALWNAGCSNPRLSKIKTSGEIAPEELPTNTAHGPWTAGCLEEGRRAHGSSLRLLLAERPSYDLSRFEFRSEDFRFKPDVTDLKAGRMIGRLVVINPNDATLKEMDEFTADWNKDAAQEGAAGLAWQRKAGTANVWRSVRMVFQVEKEGSFDMKALDDAASYEKLYPEKSDAHRRDRLYTFGELEQAASAFAPSVPGLVTWILPSYAGLVTLEAEMAETYREDGSPAGCLPVEQD